MLAAIQYGRWLHECERGGERHLVLCVGGKTVTKDEMRLWFHTSDEPRRFRRPLSTDDRPPTTVRDGRARGRPTQSTRELIVALVDGLWAYQGSLIFFMGPLGTKIRQI